ncbi:MAG TPA: hypothetical protein PKX33_02310 [Candidatus Paceibacterota bacterium]|jgi:hypothetical protein|nr:hypothetical protein [Candidatus Paceibacterota bacterium]HOO48016.1 hypothetical protein [Candidatus Paceibacterota bacterium]HOX91012.1 hypothetical protein [Candidatus Paceibacterota bacterium]HPC12716.1 hypothetical protein [Candidatus Paceibacterota bacterium]HPI82672.1 hypothetical protein [Candidatus Paceibacterota bacterium]
MRKEKALFIIGLWISALSFLGFPQTWRNVLFLITGLVIIYLSYLFYIESRARILRRNNQSKTFVDNVNSLNHNDDDQK